MSATSRPKNPYVGPRPFQPGEKLYGRAQEIMDLLDLLIAERIVLLYSPSGAGKTSLIQAGLSPELEVEEFQVLPVMRVSLEPPPDQLVERPSGCNRYILSLLLSLEEGLPEKQQTPIAELTGMTLAEYLDSRQGRELGVQNLDFAVGESEAEPTGALRSSEASSGEIGDFAAKSRFCTPETDSSTRVVLIFDQFEEILTVDPTDREVKAEFFAQVGAALRHPDRWALFSMREEFPAGLDPYLRSVPTRLSTTFRLDLLSPDAACQAIQEPVRQAGIPFSNVAANKLIDDLRTVRVQQPDGSTTDRLGLYVEPVQLQVVCYRLWNHLPEGATAIEEAHIQEAGDANAALAGYYADRVRAASEQTDIRERRIREWFDRQLITDQDIRGQVLKGQEQSQGLENQAITSVVDAHLVRAENRRGATWYELAHDRLIKPVKRNNARWFQTNLGPLQWQAALWDAQNRSKGLLFRDDALTKAERWAAAHTEDLLPVERDFLTACQEIRLQERKERRKNHFIQGLAAVAMLISVLVVILFFQARESEKNALAAKARAENAKLEAEKRAIIARYEKERAQEQYTQTVIAQEQSRRMLVIEKMIEEQLRVIIKAQEHRFHADQNLERHLLAREQEARENIEEFYTKLDALIQGSSFISQDDLDSSSRQIRTFFDFVEFKKLGVVYENSVLGKRYANLANIDEIAKEKGFEIIPCHVEASETDFRVLETKVADCYQQLAPKVDAVFMTNIDLTSVNIRRMLEPLEAYKLPTSSQNITYIKYGVLF